MPIAAFSGIDRSDTLKVMKTNLSLFSCRVPLVVLSSLLLMSCGDKASKQSRGLLLPDGDIEAGKTTFVAMQCNRCHTVEGVMLPDQDLPELPKIKAPVLMFHGLADRALHANGLSGTWDWLEQDLTLVTVPGAGHFVQQDAADLVTSTMKWWLAMRSTQP